MNKSNRIISLIALLILCSVIVCLAAFRERPEWKEERENSRNPVAEQQAVEKLTAFSTQCTQVEELVVESSVNLRGEVTVSDSNQFRRTSQGEMKIDTLLENGGKKMILRIEPKKDAQIIYYDIQLLLPALSSIQQKNTNLKLYHRKPGMKLVMTGESRCVFNNAPAPGTNMSLTDLCSLYCTPHSTDADIAITASGNAIVHLIKPFQQPMLANGKVRLSGNAVIRNL